MADSTAPLIPSITGNPQIDAILRTLIASAAAALTAYIVVTLKLTDPNLILSIGSAVLAILVLFAVLIWGWVHTANSQKLVVQHAVTAATTGKLPAAVYAAATIPQLRLVDNARTGAGAKDPSVIQ